MFKPSITIEIDHLKFDPCFLAVLSSSVSIVPFPDHYTLFSKEEEKIEKNE